MGAGTKQRWLLFEPTDEFQKQFALPLVVEVRYHIGKQPQWPFDRQCPFIQEPAPLYLGLKFFRIMKEGSLEIGRVVRLVAVLPIGQVTLDDLHEGGIIKESLAQTIEH